jgi:hypothetical protein
VVGIGVAIVAGISIKENIRAFERANPLRHRVRVPADAEPAQPQPASTAA